MNHRCKICGNIDGNIIYNVKERILNKGDVFAYLHCAHCGTLDNRTLRYFNVEGADRGYVKVVCS